MFSRKELVLGSLLLASLPALTGCDTEVSYEDLPQATAVSDPPATLSDTDAIQRNYAGYVTLPFNGEWIQSLNRFCNDNPQLEISGIYSSKEDYDGMTKEVVLITEERSYEVGHKFFILPAGKTWPDSLVKFREEHSNLEIGPLYAADEDFDGMTKKIILVTKPIRSLDAGNNVPLQSP